MSHIALPACLFFPLFGPLALACGLLLACAPESLRAQPSSPVVPSLSWPVSPAQWPLDPSAPSLTLTAVLTRVLEVHPTVRRAQAEAEVARLQRDAARWGRYPSLSVSAQSADVGGSAATLRVQQPVWTFGRIEHAIGAAEAQVRAGEAGIDQARRALLERAAVAFARLESALRQSRLAAEHVARQQALVDLIDRRAQGGLAAPGDARLARGRLDQARARALSLHAAVDQARTEIESLTLWPRVGVPMAPVWPAITPGAPQAMAEAFTAAAPLLQRLEMLRQSAEEDAAQRGAERLPAIVGRLERAPNLLTAQYDTRFVLAIDYQSGAGLALQSDYLARLGRVEALRAEIAANRRELELAARALWVQRETLLAQRESLSGLVEASADTVESFLRQFDAGRRTWVDVLNAERELFDARLAQAQSDGGLSETTARLLAGLGMLESLVASR